MKNLPKIGTIGLILATAGVATLVACGSGSSYTAPPLTISGTAAKGAPLANATVSVTCAVGSGTATTGSNGSYTVSVVAPAAMPCVLTASTSTVTLRSVATGTSPTVNITPLTEMLVSYIASQTGNAAATPAALVANTNFQKVVTTPATFTASTNAVIAVIQTAAGPGVSVPTDFLTASIVPASGGTAGNAQDAILDTLATKGVVTSTGAPSPTTQAAVQTDAGKHSVTGGT